MVQEDFPSMVIPVTKGMRRQIERSSLTVVDAVNELVSLIQESHTFDTCEEIKWSEDGNLPTICLTAKNGVMIQIQIPVYGGSKI